MVRIKARRSGFTLIELLIAIAVIGILATLAIPSYMDYVTRSRRAEAQSYLLELALREEQYRANNPAYADHLTLGNVNNTSYYHYTISAGTNTYTIAAQAQGTQASHDAPCTFIKLNQSGNKCAFATDLACDAPSDTNKCWKS